MPFLWLMGVEVHLKQRDSSWFWELRVWDAWLVVVEGCFLRLLVDWPWCLHFCLFRVPLRNVCWWLFLSICVPLFLLLRTLLKSYWYPWERRDWVCSVWMVLIEVIQGVAFVIIDMWVYFVVSWKRFMLDWHMKHW